jgi:glycogen debranching enzyme
MNNAKINVFTLFPQPILPAHSEWVDLYWKAWELALRNVEHGSAHNGFADAFLGSAFSENIFQIDSCFIVQFARYGWHCLPVLPTLDNFYRKQESDGYICREYRGCNGAALWAKGSPDAMNPPLFSWAEWSYYQVTGDVDRLRNVLPRLVVYHRWIAARLRNENGLYRSSSWGCGMDNTPRYAASWVDFSAQMALDALYLERIARAVGEDSMAAEFLGEHADLKERINTLMWDEKAGYYWDLDAADEPVPAKTLAPFWTLMAEVALPERARRLAEHLANPQEFWRTHVFPSLSADHPCYCPKGNYWRGSVWPMTNYAVIKGLSLYGFQALARRAAENHLAQMATVHRNTGTIWENYAPEAPKPGCISKPDFVGFSGVSPIALLIEEILGIHVDAPAKTIRWRLYHASEHGIKDLRVGDNMVSLLAQETDLGKVVIRVTTQKAFTLIVQGEAKKWELVVLPGTHRFVFVVSPTDK